jgi:ectoine hydroxylase-related dioxygenase (phytanoyl-CoA dioxygenase family)
MTLKDLSTELNDALSSTVAGDSLQKFRLSDQQIAHFHQFGYVSGIRVVDEQTVSDLRDQLTELFDPNHRGKELWHEYHSNESADPDKTLFHALGAWRIKPAFHDLLWNLAWLIPASQLLEGSVRFWHDQLFCKPAQHGGNVAWHQDYSYWTRTKPLAHLTCWVGLDKVDQENGCLHYIPSSHNWDLLPSTGLAGDMDAIRSVLDDTQWEQFQNPVPIELEAGECTFHHPLMVHGSFANESDRPRRGTVINVVRDGVESYTDDPLLNGVPVVPKGQPLGGQFFPLLYDAE